MVQADFLPEPGPAVLEALVLPLLLLLQRVLLWVVPSAQGAVPCTPLPLPGIAALHPRGKRSPEVQPQPQPSTPEGQV